MKGRRKKLRQQNEEFRRLSKAYYDSKFSQIFKQVVVLSLIVLLGALYKDTNNLSILCVFLLTTFYGGYILVKRFFDGGK